ncbi:SDR family NAD(P)-dependent oxidoreductase [Microbulbifer sp. 2304DJ12-6]|uniref:SDR family NAD(P)-dependent oxidoreductase n=1 Tax=Microbulbifer sp. 2304DJ12-6 TaxID=3233340 RepID=UPI0039B0E9C1
MDERLYFKGKIGFITGGASGIGASLARLLAEYGCHVIVADIQERLAAQVVEEIEALGGTAQSVVLDVRDLQEFHRIVNDAPHLDFLFNNAGVGVGGYISDHEPEDWRIAIDVNLYGVIHGVRCGYEVMRKQAFGHIINTASMAGLIPSPAMAAYSASKSAVVSLSKSLRAEAAELGIKVSVLCPGAVNTPILKGGGINGRMPTAIPPEQQAAIFESLGPISPEAFAKRALQQIAANKEVIIVPSKLKLLWWLERLWPSMLTNFAFKQMQKILRPLGLQR